MVLELKEASPDQLDSLWTANFVCIVHFYGISNVLAWGAPLDLQSYLVNAFNVAPCLTCRPANVSSHKLLTSKTEESPSGS